MMPIQPLPFRIGRRPGLELVLPSHRVSKLHAEIFEEDGVLRIRDHQSRNGTFVNHRPRDPRPRSARATSSTSETSSSGSGRKHRQARRADDSSQTATFTAFHPLAPVPRGGPRASRSCSSPGQSPSSSSRSYACPARGSRPTRRSVAALHPRSPHDPGRASCGSPRASAPRSSSRGFASEGGGARLGQRRHRGLFLNTHPAELAGPGPRRVDGGAAQPGAPARPHPRDPRERPGPARGHRRSCATSSRRSTCGLAYDDFGAGQARLLELAEAPPHYLKFDRRFVAGIDQAPPSRRRLVASLVAAARELLVKTVAEGVETPAEAEVCARLGFTHAQGYHFGRPAALAEA